MKGRKRPQRSAARRPLGTGTCRFRDAAQETKQGLALSLIFWDPPLTWLPFASRSLAKILVIGMKGRAARGARGAAEAQQPRPCDRYKHACAVCRGFVYLYGGHGSTTLRDFWRYHTVKNEWEMLDCSKDGPEELEEHSMVAYKGSLYIFGGMVDSAFTQGKTPLWIYDIDSARWTESCNEPAETESSAPANRKGHTAVVYHSSMYIYGGYFGIKGISQEFWEFRFDTGKWLCVSSPCHSSGPGARHGHSAVVYHTAMYLFGGLVGLTEQRDLWKWDFGSSSWSSIRTRNWCGFPNYLRFH
ncbi:leucine-zipper-like transcriptional regulator 1 isoform X5 [Motacilla alba alba]|uniref:leucine-zipper-like transcriptional regulator 1 isoform X5 n=1 Tax=Motacilla alba alba TaxID=1094192 RepID=UPI0018D54F2C|nr:leucine-zipper-like transcriptional regulator 1 isoform X5 [Motacilla alba alba]